LLDNLFLLDQYQGGLSSPEDPDDSSSNEEKLTLIMPFLIKQLEIMKENFPRFTLFVSLLFVFFWFRFFRRTVFVLKHCGITLSCSFPQEDEERELIIDSQSFKSQVSFSYDSNTADMRGLFLMFYLLGQYEIVVNTIQEIDDLFQVMEEVEEENIVIEEEEEEEEDTEEEQEDCNEEDDEEEEYAE
jgi:hypothetical protein